MPRIRTIKPEFWTDSRIVQLPFEARLFYIGLWNYADDDGYVIDEPDRLKMQILPNDEIDVWLLIDLLVVAGFLDRLSLSDGRSALGIRSFNDHQQISHRGKSKIKPAIAGKPSIPQAVRQAVARKYGHDPTKGEYHPAECYYCGAESSIYWPWLRHPRKGKARPGSWVAFGLELDHFLAESQGGPTTAENIVLACRPCNRSKGPMDGIEFAGLAAQGLADNPRNPPADSGDLRKTSPGKDQGKEGNGKDQGKEGSTDSAAPQGGPAPDIFIELPLIPRDGAFEVEEAAVASWIIDFPGVDVPQELHKMRAWLKANPTRRKTRRGVNRFIVNWLGRAQDSGRRNPPSRAASNREAARQFVEDEL